LAIRVTNNLQTRLSLSGPISDTLGPRETKTYLYIEYDKCINDSRLAYLLSKHCVAIVNLDTLDDYASQWNQTPKLQLGAYFFWIDVLNHLRMKVGEPTSDFDGVSIGPGASSVKAAEVLAAAFAGNPKIAAVTFVTPYTDTSYSISLGCSTSSNTQFTPSVENKAVGGFDINMGCNDISGLVAVMWFTIPYGEA
jgi:hypothetical protein